MTITEKILAAHSGRKGVEPGELIMAKVDLAMGNDITAPIAIEEFRAVGAKKVFDRTRVALVPSHFAPNKDIKSADQCNVMRQFAREQEITHYYEQGQAGIEHALLPEKGVVVPGDVVIGADSHSCTYGAVGCFSTGVGSTDLAAILVTGEVWLRVPESFKFIYHGKLRPWVTGKDMILNVIGRVGDDGAHYMAMEHTGETVDRMSMDQRLTMCNMAIEAGAKSGLVAPDEITMAYMKNRAERKPVIYTSDKDATYARVEEFDCAKMVPTVAFPHLPSKARPVTEAAHIKVDQAFIGSCTNGRIEDLRIAAGILKGRKVHPYTRLIITPATQGAALLSAREGLTEIFIESGAVVTAVSCGACLGGHSGVLGAGEKCISTTNRNYVGRMGSPKAEIYLANPAVVAASAILGRIGHPDEVVVTKRVRVGAGLAPARR